MSNPRSSTRRQSWITTYRVVTLVLLVALLGLASFLAFRLPSVTEIAQAVNGPADFKRPSTMEYVVKTDSCVVGGTVVSTEWQVGGEAFDVGEVDSNTVDYTAFEFKSDEGRTFTVSEPGPLYTEPGENLGLQLRCDQSTMTTDQSFGMVSIIYGGK